MPTVSIIIPVYNCEPYLRECIDSALSQSFADLELILVDDESPDGSGAIIDDYAARDARVLAIHQKNGGQSAARNAGLEAASGRYIYLLDSDDVMDPSLLETIIPKMDAGYDMVAFGARTFPDREELLPAQEETELLLESEEARYAFLAGPFRRRTIRWEVWNRLYRRDVIERWNVCFPADRRAYPEDMFFNLCYLAHISRILCIPDILYSYRKRPGSITVDIYNSAHQLMFLSSNLQCSALEEHYLNCADCSYLSANFPQLRFLLHKAAFRRLRKHHWNHSLSLEDARELLRENVQDYPSFIDEMRAVFQDQVVVESYHKDKDALVQFTDRLYEAELLDVPSPGWKKAIRRILLGLLRIPFRLKPFYLRLVR